MYFTILGYLDFHLWTNIFDYCFSGINLNPPTSAMTQNDVVYNCTPDVTTKLSCKPVSPARLIQPYPCSFLFQNLIQLKVV